MAFLANRTINLLNLHYAIHSIALGGGHRIAWPNPNEHVHVRAVFRRLRFPTGQVRGESNLGSLDCETFRLMPC